MQVFSSSIILLLFFVSLIRRSDSRFTTSQQKNGSVSQSTKKNNGANSTTASRQRKNHVTFEPLPELSSDSKSETDDEDYDSLDSGEAEIPTDVKLRNVKSVNFIQLSLSKKHDEKSRSSSDLSSEGHKKTGKLLATEFSTLLRRTKLAQPSVMKKLREDSSSSGCSSFSCSSSGSSNESNTEDVFDLKSALNSKNQRPGKSGGRTPPPKPKRRRPPGSSSPHSVSSSVSNSISDGNSQENFKNSATSINYVNKDNNQETFERLEDIPRIIVPDPENFSVKHIISKMNKKYSEPISTADEEDSKSSADEGTSKKEIYTPTTYRGRVIYPAPTPPYKIVPIKIKRPTNIIQEPTPTFSSFKPQRNQGSELRDATKPPAVEEDLEQQSPLEVRKRDTRKARRTAYKNGLPISDTLSQELTAESSLNSTIPDSDDESSSPADEESAVQESTSRIPKSSKSVTFGNIYTLAEPINLGHDEGIQAAYLKWVASRTIGDFDFLNKLLREFRWRLAKLMNKVFKYPKLLTNTKPYVSLDFEGSKWTANNEKEEFIIGYPRTFSVQPNALVFTFSAIKDNKLDDNTLTLILNFPKKTAETYDIASFNTLVSTINLATTALRLDESNVDEITISKQLSNYIQLRIDLNLATLTLHLVEYYSVPLIDAMDVFHTLLPGTIRTELAWVNSSVLNLKCKKCTKYKAAASAFNIAKFIFALHFDTPLNEVRTTEYKSRINRLKSIVPDRLKFWHKSNKS